MRPALATPLALLAAVGLLTPGLGLADDGGLSPDAGPFAAAAADFDASLLAQGAPGGALAIVVDGHLAFRHAAGVTQLGGSELVRPTTLFQWASVTKLLTSIAALRLAERHRLRLSSSISGLLPELHLAAPNAGEKVTFEELLHHTSGLPSGLPADPHLDILLPDYLPRYLAAHEAPLLSPPGRLFNYANLGFALLGLALERAGRAPYEQVIRDEVLTPAGMSTATLDPAEAAAADHAIGYGFGSGGASRVEPDTIWGARYKRPFGGLQASAIDLAHLAEALLEPGRLLPGSALEQLAAEPMPTGETPFRSYGRGLFVEAHRGVRVVYHHGDQGGFGSILLLVPERRLAVVLVASLTAYPARAVAFQIVDRLLSTTEPEPELTTAPSTWRKYQGKYFDPDLLQHFRVVLRSEKLWLVMEDGFTTELQQTAGDSFTFKLPRRLGEAQRTGTFWLDARGRGEYFALTNAVGTRE
jgi:CubicO group peptidase (beta-lactamase class C family)